MNAKHRFQRRKVSGHRLTFFRFHFGPATSAKHIAKAIAVAQGLDPHLVVLTGDDVQYSATGIKHILAQRVHPELFGWTRYRREVRKLAINLRELLDPLSPRDGIIGVFGNHDYKEGIGTIRRKLEDKVIWLKNSARIVRKPGGSLLIAGLDDLKRGKPDLRATLEQGEARKIITCTDYYLI